MSPSCRGRGYEVNNLPRALGYNDHWRRITTAHSTDEGKTWTDHQVHFKYGKVHSELLTLKNGDILLTYAARMGEFEGQMYHGIEAVLSRDHGKTLDWQNRFILARGRNNFMHSPISLERSDGRILTVYLDHDSPYYRNSGPPVIGHTQAVIWSPYAATQRP